MPRSRFNFNAIPKPPLPYITTLPSSELRAFWATEKRAQGLRWEQCPNKINKSWFKAD
ncbi:hypothetical protein BGZ99_004050, partial [Dissophora globulifera]